MDRRPVSPRDLLERSDRVDLDRRALLTGATVAGLALVPASAFAQGRPASPATLLTASPAAAPALPAAGPRVTRAGLEAVLDRTLGSATDRVGVTVIDRRTGVWFSHQGDRRVEMASTAKVLILAAFLRARRGAGRTLTSFDRSLVQAMIRSSDNAAASRLLRAAGGRAALADLARRLRMSATADSAAGTSAWGKIATTSDDQAMLLQCLAAGGYGILHRDDCAYVLAEMRSVTSSQAWGVGAVRSAAVSVAVKNGWAPLSPDYQWRINSIGHVRGNGRDYVLAMFEKGLASQATGIARKNAVSKAVYAALAQPLHVR